MSHEAIALIIVQLGLYLLLGSRIDQQKKTLDNQQKYLESIGWQIDKIKSHLHIDPYDL